MIAESLSKIEKVLESRREVIAAYLFGSSLYKNDFNDIDIGLLLDENFRAPPLYEAKLAGELEKVAGKLNFDVRILNNLSVRFLFNILKNSILIHCKNERRRVEFESRVMMEYLDIKPFHNYYEKMRRLRYGVG